MGNFKVINTLSNRIKVSLRTKILGLTIGIIILMRVVEFVYVDRIMIPDLEEEFIKKTEVVIDNLHLVLLNPLLTDSYSTVSHIIYEVKGFQSNIEYIFITDYAGKVVAHTFKDGFPIELLKIVENNNIPWKKLSEHLKYIKIDTGGNLLYNLAYSYENNGWQIYAGFSNTYITSISKLIKIISIIITLFMLIIGTVISLILSNHLTKPLEALVSATESVKNGDINIKINIQTGDELQYLGENFNRMVESIRLSRKEIEEMWNRLIQSEKYVATATLTAGLAHEVYNPLSGIRNCLKILKTKNLDENKKEEYFNIIFEAIERIDRIVRGLLDYSRRSENKKEKIDVLELINSTLLLLTPAIDKRKISFNYKIRDSENFFTGEKGKLQQVITNLLVNAIHAIDGKNNGKIEIDVFRKEDRLCIKISDNGIGIPSNIKHRVFDPFFTTKPPGMGTGLGLPVSLSIVESMGGTITLTSIEGVGTDVEVNLPLP